jgi:hypothetical protein
VAVGEDGVSTNPGPLARFEVVIADPKTPDVLVQRLASGETLKEIAKAWEVPYRRLLAWVASSADLTEQCKRVLELAGIELRLDGLEIIDEADPETIAVAKEQAAYRERLSRDLNRPLFGKHVRHEHKHTVDLGERLRRARERVIELQEPATPASVPAPAVVDAELI